MCSLPKLDFGERKIVQFAEAEKVTKMTMKKGNTDMVRDKFWNAIKLDQVEIFAAEAATLLRRPESDIAEPGPAA